MKKTRLKPLPRNRTQEEWESEIGRKLLANEPLTQMEIGKLFGISQARVLAHEKQALAKLRVALGESWAEG